MCSSTASSSTTTPRSSLPTPASWPSSTRTLMASSDSLRSPAARSCRRLTTPRRSSSARAPSSTRCSSARIASSASRAARSVRRARSCSAARRSNCSTRPSARSMTPSACSRRPRPSRAWSSAAAPQRWRWRAPSTRRRALRPTSRILRWRPLPARSE
eukprot:Amastigsp_a512768_109.p3 type:complete len:158 gc:universal Amastigsp_a512768_109:750-277(-)